MLDKKTREVYQSITAPEDLRERILNIPVPAGKNYRKRAVMRAVSAAAALVILAAATLFSGVLTYPNISTDGSLIGTAPAYVTAEAAKAYSVEEGICVILDVDVRTAATLSVTEGALQVESGDCASSVTLWKDARVYWTTGELAAQAMPELQVRCGLRKEDYVLKYDSAMNKWEIYQK